MELDARLRLVVTRGFAAVAVGVSIVVAAQRQQFTHPGGALLPIVLALLPWLAVGAGLTDPLPARARTVLSMAVAVDVVACTYWLVIGYPQHQGDLAPFAAVVAVAFVAGGVGIWWGATVVVACLLCSVGFDLSGHYPFDSWTPWLFAFVIAWIGGAGLRFQFRLTQRLQEAQAGLARQAAETERNRLAREVHDLIAHSLAVSMLHLTGARLALRAGDTAEAIDALEEAERAGRAAMTEIHHTVGLLGSGQEQRVMPATPAGADIPELVDDFRGAGLPVELLITGSLTGVSMSAGLAAYRIVEESLANAVKHARGSAVTVVVTVADGSVGLRVANRVAATTGPHLGWSRDERMGSGSGVLGMRERASAVGGQLSAGEVDGCWTVEATIPLAEPAP